VRAALTRWRMALLIGAPVIALAAAAAAWWAAGATQRTDDAALAAGHTIVAAQVAGQVQSVEVRENQQVHAGDVLFRLDPEIYQAAVDEAAARLEEAKAQSLALHATFRGAQSSVSAASARLDYARAEEARQKALLDEGIASKDQFELAQLGVQTAEDDLARAAQTAGAARAALGHGGGLDAQPAVLRAEVALARAQLDLDHTIVRAALDGTVTHVSLLQVGNAVGAGKPALTIVGRRVWVEANFKENQLARLRIGQRVHVKLDAYPGRTFAGHVASFSPGTGSSFSLLPAENATGNWVKVVQRVPVIVELDSPPTDIPMPAGLSASVTVDTTAAQ